MVDDGGGFQARVTMILFVAILMEILDAMGLAATRCRLFGTTDFCDCWSGFVGDAGTRLWRSPPSSSHTSPHVEEREAHTRALEYLYSH